MSRGSASASDHPHKGKTLPPGLDWCILRSGLLALPLLVGSGCSMLNHKVNNDPLRGDVASPTAGPVGQTAGTTDANQTAQGMPLAPPPNQTASLPALPPPMLNLTPAGLASGVQQTVNPNSSYVLASNQSSLNDQGLSANPGPVNLSGEILPDTPTPSGPPAPENTTPDSQAASAAAWQQMNAALKSRNILWRKGPTPVPGTTDTFSFACAVPVPGSPGESMVYEKTAPGEGGLAVMRSVLADIDQATPH